MAIKLNLIPVISLPVISIKGLSFYFILLFVPFIISTFPCFVCWAVAFSISKTVYNNQKLHYELPRSEIFYAFVLKKLSTWTKAMVNNCRIQS